LLYNNNNNKTNDIREQSKFAFERAINTIIKAFNLIDDQGMKIINELTQDIILDSHKQTYIRICKLFSDKYDLYRIFQNEYYIEQENDIEDHIMKTLR